MFILEIVTEYTSVMLNTVFQSKRRANNALRKLQKEMAKGKFRNDTDVVQIKGDASTMVVCASRIIAAHVVDQFEWARLQKMVNDKVKAEGEEESSTPKVETTE